MKIREIAELTGRSKRAVELWCEKTSQVICEKISQARKTSIASDFTLEETIEILRAGKMGASLISLLKENAEKKNMPAITETVEIVKSILEPFLKQQNEFNKMLLQEIKSIKLDKPIDQNLLPASQPTKFEVEIVDLPNKYARAASAAVNSIIRKEERKKRFNEMCPELFS